MGNLISCSDDMLSSDEMVWLSVPATRGRLNVQAQWRWDALVCGAAHWYPGLSQHSPVTIPQRSRKTPFHLLPRRRGALCVPLRCVTLALLMSRAGRCVVVVQRA
jgi:hypothetical protein